MPVNLTVSGSSRPKRSTSLDGGAEIEDQVAGAGIPYHAPGPEKRRIA
jgi:hypothetical protein